MYEVNNIRDYEGMYEYAVIFWCEGGYWFWSAWDDRERAEQSARDREGAFVVRMSDVIALW